MTRKTITLRELKELYHTSGQAKKDLDYFNDHCRGFNGETWTKLPAENAAIQDYYNDELSQTHYCEELEDE